MGYRGPLKLRFKIIPNVNGERGDLYNIGDRIGQIMVIPRPKINFIEVDELSNTDRGEGGFGSTNK